MRKSTRRIFTAAIVFMLLFASATLASAQMRPMGKDAVRGWLQNLKLTDQELQQISKIIEADEAELARAQAEIKIIQSKIARLMLESTPDLDAIKEEIGKSAEYEKTIKFIQIKRQLEVKEVLGEERWQTVLMLVREARVSEKFGKFADSFSSKGMNPKDADRWGRMLLMLKRFM